MSDTIQLQTAPDVALVQDQPTTAVIQSQGIPGQAGSVGPALAPVAHKYVTGFTGQSWNTAQPSSSDMSDVGTVGQTIFESSDATGTGVRQTIYASPFDAMSYNGMQVNGSMDVDQRNAGLSVSLTGVAGYKKIIDNVAVNCAVTTAGFSAQQVSDAPPGYTHSLKVSVTTAKVTLGTGDQIEIWLPVEGYRAARLGFGTSSAQSVSIAFWVKANRTGTYCFAIQNNASNRSYVTTFTINFSATWQFVTFTIPGDTAGTWLTDNSGGGLFAIITMAAGTVLQTTGNTWTAGNFVATSAQINGVAATTDFMQVTGLLILPGIELPSSSRAPFIMRPFDTERMLCQRLFVCTFPYGTQPGNNKGQSGEIGASTGTFSTGQAAWLQWNLPVPMRVAPTVTTYNPTSTTAGDIGDAFGGTNVLPVSSTFITELIVAIASTPASSTGITPAVHLTADAGL